MHHVVNTLSAGPGITFKEGREEHESVKWRALRALRALVPSMLACPRARVPKFSACPRAIDVGVPSCPRARVPKFSACPRAFYVGVPSCPRALVPKFLAGPRALVPAWPNSWRAFDAGVPSRLNFRRALVPSMLMFRTLLRDVTLEMFLESLKLSDPFFLNFIRKT